MENRGFSYNKKVLALIFLLANLSNRDILLAYKRKERLHER